MASVSRINDDRLALLQQRLPSCLVITDEGQRTLYAQDIFTRAQPALAVVRPTSTEQLSAAVREITSLGLAAVPRGGGLSYTSGYVPAEADSIIVDLSAMDHILDINDTDMTVTVEAGCTWLKLYETLKPRGLRTPFWGSLSGKFATVGGAASQNAVFWGCGLYGSAVDSILAIDVVLADGSVLKTAPGHFRPYGPDLTGLFCADTGALGFKATVTLKLIRDPKAVRFASFSFSDYEKQCAAMCEIARSQLASECFGFDPYLQAIRMKRESLAHDARALVNLMKAQGSLLGALKEGAKVALAGRSFLDQVPYSLHVISEGRWDSAVDQDIAEVKRICASYGATEVENSIPKILRANPFGPVNSMVGPQGERWVPIHGLLSLGKAAACIGRIEEMLAQHKAEMDRLQVGTGYLFATVGITGFVVEPVFFWPDALTEIHRQYVEADYLDKLAGYGPNPEARALVMTLRAHMIDIFHDMGAAHLQIGKSYLYRDALGMTGRQIMDAVKRSVDPAGRINPGSLGF
jgi:FAD/FMN-containing dehydrogenase